MNICENCNQWPCQCGSYGQCSQPTVGCGGSVSYGAQHLRHHTHQGSRARCGPKVCNTPYYQTVSTCPEDNKEHTVELCKSQTYRNICEFAVPDCDKSVSITFEDIGEIHVGAFLWNRQVGYLEITGFNPAFGQMELSNPCIGGCGESAAPGTPVGAMTSFILTAPPCPSTFAESTFPFLDADFTAPQSGDCIDITVTNVNGLVAGKIVIIAGGEYRLNDILSTTTVEICNDGDGVTPMTPVIAKDSKNNHIVPITLVDTNACTSTPVHAAAPLGCVNGITYPMVGTANGQILVYDHGTGLSNFRTIGIPTLDCTVLAVSLTLDPALDPSTEYLAIVEDTADFSAVPGDQNNIVTISGTFFQVMDIADATHMHLFPLEVPSAIQTYEAGSLICTADCCSILDIRVTHIENNEDPNGDQYASGSSNYADAVAISATDISAGSSTIVGNISKLTLTNPSGTLAMGVHVVWNFHFTYDVYAADGAGQEVSRFAEVAFDASDVAATALVLDSPVTHVVSDLGAGAAFNRQSHDMSFSQSYALAAGETKTIQGKATMSFNSPGEATKVTVQILATRISYMAIALPA